MKDILTKKTIKTIYILFILSGCIIISIALALHQNLNAIYSGDYARINFQSRPYLEYEAQVQWENHLTDYVSRDGSNDQIKKLMKGEESFDKQKVKIQIFNENSKLISFQIMEPSPIVLPDGSRYIPDSSLMIPPDRFHNYTVIFEQLHNRTTKNSTFPRYTVVFSPQSSEGNAVIPFLIGLFGSFSVVIGIFIAYTLFKNSMVHTMSNKHI